MKLNGALKPRQGASRQGSSPGVVQRKYRVKRYYKVIENVVNSLPVNECGVNNPNNSTNNNIYKNNQQQHLQQQKQATPFSQQLWKKKCGENFNNSNSSSSRSSLSSSNFSISTKTKKQNKPTTSITTQSRVPAVTKTRLCCSDLNSHGNKNKIQHTTKVAAEAVTETAAIEKYNEKNINCIEIDLEQRTAVNKITTRQINNTKTNKEYKSNKNNNKGGKKTKQVKLVKTTLKTSKHHVIINKSYNKNNNNSSNSVSNTYFKEVNKLLISKIYENQSLTVIISRLLVQLKLLLFFMFSHAIQHLTGNPFVRCCVDRITNCVSEGARSGTYSFALIGYNLAKIMRAPQSLESSFERICFKNVNKTRLPPSIALCMMVYAAAAILLPQPVIGDDGDTFFPINGLETTTPEFDYASRGQKKFGDKCENTLECGFPGSICDPKKKSCQCTEDLPVTNHIDKCGKEAAVNESCFFNEQCEVKYFQTECRDQRCVCRFDMTPIWLKDGTVECKGRGDKKGPETYIDPAMIGVLIGMALMFIIICVVLRLFSQARWRENRTIFNTPNPRLMNVSLLRESKLLHGQERRGSRMSVRGPSRQPSMASLRPHSPNPSLGKTGSRSNSHGSNASATSLRSTRSNSVSPAGIIVNNSHHERKGSTYQPHQHQHHPSQQKMQQQQLQTQEQQPLTQTNIISNPVAETVTVEIIEPEK